VYSVSGQNPVTYKGVNAISLAITNADRGNTDKFLSINPTILLVVFLLYESIKFVFFLSLLLAILFFSF
jgi:hypothetical protein